MTAISSTSINRTPYWWALGLGVLIAVIAFSGSLAEVVNRWMTQEEYGHGFFIPLISAWLLWTRRDVISESIGQPSWTGLALILLAGIMLIVGELSAFFLLAQLGFVVALLGITLAFGGYSLLKTVLVPILILIFAIPLPYFIDSILSWRLQILSSQLGVAFIRLFDIPVYLEGNVIDLGNYKLQVLEACSGLRYLYPLLSLAFLAAYFFNASLWKRALVFLSAIPITIAMNSLRIGIVGVTVHLWGTQMAEGVLHFFEGWIIFLVCAALLALVMYVLARVGPQTGRAGVYVPKVQASSRTEPSVTQRNWRPLLSSLLVLLAAGVFNYQISQRQEIIPDRSRFVSFPEQLGAWRGTQSELAPDVEHFLGVDDYLLSDYVGPGNRPVNLYIAYYGSQRKGSSPHSPRVCIPGGGWEITQLQRRAYVDPETGINLAYNRAIIEKGSDKQIVYYWFSQRGRNIANEFVSKWYLLEDAMLQNRTDGALVRLTTQVGAAETEQDADKRLENFLPDVVPRLGAFLPGLAKDKKTACEGSC